MSLTSAHLHALESLAAEDSRDQIAILDDFIDSMLVKRVIQDVETLRDQFKPAGVGVAASHRLSSEIRRDRILWFEPESLTPVQAEIWARIDDLRRALNESLYLGLWDFETHYAVYETGGFYQKHVDRFQTDGLRTISFVLYLNEAWTPPDGGQLVLFTSQGEKTVEPLSGRMICFSSASVEHEVRVAHRNRRSVTGWMRRRP